MRAGAARGKGHRSAHVSDKWSLDQRDQAFCLVFGEKGGEFIRGMLQTPEKCIYQIAYY